MPLGKPASAPAPSQFHDGESMNRVASCGE